MGEGILRLEDVTFGYRRREPVVRGVDLELRPGLELVVGPNGAGKSTLLKLLAGVERPDSGRVWIDGFDAWKDEARARRDLAYLPEQPDLTPYATVREILELVCRLRGGPRGEVATVLERVGLGEVGGRSVRELSMGQRRRAVLAAAWIGSPNRLVLDEPLEAMDREGREVILEWIDEVRSAAGTVVVVSHELRPMVPRVDRVTAVRDGVVARVEELPADPETRRSLLEAAARGELPDPARRGGQPSGSNRE